MCVIFLAYRQSPAYPLILLANRDEFYERPTAKAAYWKDFPHILGGRDLIGGGTWLGVTKNGRFAAVTNYRDPLQNKGTISRGNLVADFLKTRIQTEKYLKKVKTNAEKYTGFNLLTGEINNQREKLFYYSNRENKIRKLEKGIYGLSNNLLDVSWPKVNRGKEELAEIIEKKEFEKENFFKILNDKNLAEDENLPATGIGYEREKLLSAIFIETPVYGTRCSSVLTFDKDLKIDFEERVYI